MPYYQYKCHECEESFERRLPMSEASSTQTCPECGSDDTRKQLSAFSVGGSRPASRAAVKSIPSPFT